MARSWPLRLRSLHSDSCAGERVIGVKVNLASSVMSPALGHCDSDPYTQIPAPGSALRVKNLAPT
ncbi:hypothetical protein CCE29_02665 [Lacticaseibacillus rhamnosus]|nr:hypothetical protein B4583_02120 [Lacticaseibacillus rhamnosus]CAR86772.1 Putative protein without homology [Lacticaseibacillus rhamnosus GG]ART94976.1 hypothetical protein CCE29_02665 [Lacticaseibacillus rhamnosus]AZZ22498.1 hypothetical protein CYG41_04565 [Lacticaseibacillus rhamnosus]RXU54734.1 hypothetical protein CYG42_02060 [Lacticaseibacillus rhamnosus]